MATELKVWSTVSMILRSGLACLVLIGSVAPAQVKLSEGDGKIDVAIDGKLFTTFYYGSRTPKPYLHPVRAADGTIVTRGYPMEMIEGERRDHPHHRSLWFTHGDVNGFDFWANEDTQDRPHKGRVVVKRVSLKGKDRIAGSFEWRGPAGDVLVVEDRMMTFGSQGANRFIDFDLTLTAASQQVRFRDTKEGTFAIRLATPLEEPHERAEGIPRTGRITAADGRTGEPKVWGTRSPWVDYSGEIDGTPLGVAIFDHPANPKHPTYWHVRSYGLFAANVFGEHHFYQDDSRDGGITIESGKSLRFRYQVLIHAGDTRQAGVGRLYEEWIKGESAGKTE